MRRIRQLSSGWVSFHCPACGYGHAVPVNGTTAKDSTGKDVSWEWNNNLELPTLKPSIMVNRVAFPGYPKCHIIITDGKLHFMGDCSHDLKGKVVEMEDVDA